VSWVIEYLFLDAIYESLRRYGDLKEAILCAWGITEDGRKVLISLGLGNKESYECWLEFLRDMVARGMGPPVAVTSDGAPGLIKAIEAVFPKSIRIRCWYHRMGNFRGKVPQEMWPEIKVELEAIRDAANHKQGVRLAQEFISRHKDLYPSL
jgi:transposase-like protein